MVERYVGRSQRCSARWQWGYRPVRFAVPGSRLIDTRGVRFNGSVGLTQNRRHS